MVTCSRFGKAVLAGALALAAGASTTWADDVAPAQNKRGDYVLKVPTARDNVLLSDGIVSNSLRGPGACNIGTGCQARNLTPPAGEPFAVFSQSTNNTRAAESFTASGTATSLCWWGIFFNGGAPFAQPAADSYQITYYADAGGYPGAVIGGPFVVGVGSGLTTSLTGEQVGAAAFPVHEFRADHAPVNLSGCVWVEIVNTAVTGDERFGWFTSTSGNAYYAQDTDSTTTWANYNTSGAVDLAFCSNASTGVACGTLPTGSTVCTLTPFTQCQDAQAPGVANALLADGVDQLVADDFRLSANAQVTQICFTGLYATGEPPAGDTFQITIYNDSNGQPGTVVDQWLTGDADVVITSSFEGDSGFGLPRFNYRAQITNGPTLLASNCYWIEVANLSGTDWYWMTAEPGTSRQLLDGVGGGALDGYSVADADASDSAFCVSGTLAQGQGCAPNVNLPPNDQCANATAITLGQTLTGFTSIDATPGDTTIPRPDGPPCGANLDDRYAVFYRYVNGPTAQSITASVCDAATNFNTVLDVYCSSGAAGSECSSLNCVANNDDSAACAVNANRSTVEWFAQANTAYWIRVHGRSGALGNFSLNVSAGGTATTSTCTVCNLTAQPGDITETETCGGATNDNCSLAGVQTLQPGQVAFGSTFAHNGTRNFDSWRIPIANGSQVINLVGAAEFPVLFQVLHYPTVASCTSFAGVTGWQVNLPTCTTATVAGGAINVTTGQIFVRVIPGSGAGGINDFYGMPCTGAPWNEYRFSVSTNTDGSCCAGTTCTIGTLAECGFTGGVFSASATPCTPDPCGGAPATGACCTGNPGGAPPTPISCVVATAANCAAAGGSYQGDGTTCAGVGFTNNAGTNNPAPPIAPAAPYANQPGCCRANFNGVNGVSVQDLYDFFSAWNQSVNRCQGDPLYIRPTNLTPEDPNPALNCTSVQDLYDFLTLWNSGCPPIP